MDISRIVFDDAGLVPAIVQDRSSGEVLMLGYMNAASIDATLADGLVTFWSRSRQELWRKGDTSGNRLHFHRLSVDCDGDAILVEATPAGPVCHSGENTCFGDRSSEGFRRLENLWSVISDRADTRPDGSYTVELIEGGVNATTRKLTEEATEVLLAAKDHAVGSGQSGLAEEAADLLYHLFVVLAERGETPSKILDVLERRE